jgi:hypothetical protein
MRILTRTTTDITPASQSGLVIVGVGVVAGMAEAAGTGVAVFTAVAGTTNLTRFSRGVLTTVRII